VRGEGRGNGRGRKGGGEGKDREGREGTPQIFTWIDAFATVDVILTSKPSSLPQNKPSILRGSLNTQQEPLQQRID